MTVSLLSHGCKLEDPIWNQVDVDSFLCSRAYAAANGIPIVGSEQRDVVLVCKIRNRTKMRISARLRYVHPDGQMMEIQVKNPSFDPTEWTTYLTPVSFLSTNIVATRFNVQLHPIEIQAK
jgi:hypothetical protein